MGWIEKQDMATGERTLLGEPEFDRRCPDAELFPLAAQRWIAFNGSPPREQADE